MYTSLHGSSIEFHLIGLCLQLEGYACEEDIDATGMCVLPGLVDAHTHPVWVGDRVHEFSMKVRVIVANSRRECTCKEERTRVTSGLTKCSSLHQVAWLIKQLCSIGNH